MYRKDLNHENFEEISLIKRFPVWEEDWDIPQFWEPQIWGLSSSWTRMRKVSFPLSFLVCNVSPLSCAQYNLTLPFSVIPCLFLVCSSFNHSQFSRSPTNISSLFLIHWSRMQSRNEWERIKWEWALISSSQTRKENSQLRISQTRNPCEGKIKLLISKEKKWKGKILDFEKRLIKDLNGPLLVPHSFVSNLSVTTTPEVSPFSEGLLGHFKCDLWSLKRLIEFSVVKIRSIYKIYWVPHSFWSKTERQFRQKSKIRLRFERDHDVRGVAIQQGIARPFQVRSLIFKKIN